MGLLLNFKRKMAKSQKTREKVEKLGMIKNDESKCEFCGNCEAGCFLKAIAVNKEEKKWEIDHSLCIRCKTCLKNCPTKCITLE